MLNKKLQLDLLSKAFKYQVFLYFEGAFNYLRFNFSNAPTHDLTHNFLSCITKLMLAQAQECVYELEVFGGFEVELKKCIHLAGESKKVGFDFLFKLLVVYITHDYLLRTVSLCVSTKIIYLIL